MAGAEKAHVTQRKCQRRRGRREKSLQGTHLFREVRTDMLIWRRTHPITKRRMTRSTETKVLEYALARAKKFDDVLEREVAGLRTYDGWTRQLANLVDEWFEDQRKRDCPPVERWLDQKERVVRRALEVLRLDRAADLTDVGKIDMRLKALAKRDATLRRRYQDPLKQFSRWLAENGRYLDRDPLLVWRSIRYESGEMHRAFGPDEVARALTAADWLDQIHGRAHSLRPVFALLLVTAPRISALASRNAEHYLQEDQRVDYGKRCGKKRRGQGKLDARTDGELSAYLNGRTEGPLVLSPRGNRIQNRNVLRWWREAFSLGLVWELWPEEVWDVQLGHLVNMSLLTKRTRILDSGNPRLIRESTKKKREALRDRVAGLADEILPEWKLRMKGVTLHAFRHTHQTWARALDVDQVLINLQVGWKVSARANHGLDAMHVASTTGLSCYLDARSKLLDARQSANAVRRILDKAQSRVDRELVEDRRPRLHGASVRLPGDPAGVPSSAICLERSSALATEGRRLGGPTRGVPGVPSLATHRRQGIWPRCGMNFGMYGVLRRMMPKRRASQTPVWRGVVR